MSSMEKDMSDSSKASNAEYIDNVRNVEAQEPHEIHYDNSGLRGILRSPYVFGAGLLASFGGFSFGYGLRFTFNSSAEPRLIRSQIKA